MKGDPCTPDRRWKWTREMADRLVTLAAEGLSWAEIGRRMHISKNSIIGKAERMGLRKRAAPSHPPRRSHKAKPLGGTGNAIRRPPLPASVRTIPLLPSEVEDQRRWLQEMGR